jgi:hypothetical protein
MLEVLKSGNFGQSLGAGFADLDTSFYSGHQAFLTAEALRNIADSSIEGLVGLQKGGEELGQQGPGKVGGG